MAAEPEPGPSTDLGEIGRADSRRNAIAATLAMGLLTGTFTWWALKFGAYFGTVMYPGVALLGVGMAIMLGAAPWRASLALSGRTRLALFSLVALVFWSALSALWSPTPDIAIEDAQRIGGYALCFGLGLWTCALLGRRMELAMAPIVGAAGVVAVVTLAQIALANDPFLVSQADGVTFLDEDGTLQHPLGYRNATAAFFLVALWPAICLASSSRVHRVVRLGAFVTATACFELAILSQSRGAIAGLIAGGIVLAIASPTRLVTLTRLAALIPAVPSLFFASDLFRAAREAPDLGATIAEMNAAGAWGLAGLAASALLALIVLRFNPDPRYHPSRPVPRRVWLYVAGGLVGALVAFSAVVGNPVTWAGDRVDEFLAGEPDLSAEDNRFTFNAGSNRSEVWRVALIAASDDPIFGEGGGGFQFRYNREREDVNQLARDAHSVWLEMLSELGVVGLALFTALIVGAFAAAIRARKLGHASAQLSAAGLAAGAYWLAHSSLDWFWPYPAVTAPALALLGAAAAPALIMPQRTAPPRSRRPLLIAIVAFVVILVPPFLSERLVDRAIETFPEDAGRAYDDLALARDLNPLTDTPALREGSIALALDDRERAIAAYREATRKRPEEYAGHLLLALIYAETDPEAARISLAVVAELNPLDPRIERIQRQIDETERRFSRLRSGR